MRFLAITTLALLAAACGSQGPSTDSTTGSTQNPATAPFRFAACMRDHGVTNFPDPHITTTPGGGSAVSQAVPQSAGDAPGFKEAQKACQGILPAPGTGGGFHGHPSKQAFLVFARCLRGHGITGFPDPNGQGQLTLEMIGAAGVDLKAPSFLTAAKACVGVTHGAIPLAAVARAINGPH